MAKKNVRELKVCAQFSLEKYLKASRTGRGTRLNRKKRMEIWKAFEACQNLMKERQIRDINTAMYECRLRVEKISDSGFRKCLEAAFSLVFLVVSPRKYYPQHLQIAIYFQRLLRRLDIKGNAEVIDFRS